MYKRQDPQGSLGFSLGLDIEHCTTIYDVFRGQAEPEQAIVRTDTCDILPSNILLSGAELEFNRPGREFLLKTALSKVEDQYDYIIIDTPPALSLLTVNAYVATDSLIIPMSPEILSLLGVSQIKETIESVRSYYNSRLRVLGILLNKFSARLTLNREVLEMAEQIAAQLDTRVFQSKIRGSVSVAESPAHGVSVLDLSLIHILTPHIHMYHVPFRNGGGVNSRPSFPRDWNSGSSSAQSAFPAG